MAWGNGIGPGLGRFGTWSGSLPGGDGSSQALNAVIISPEVMDALYSLPHPRPSVRGEEPQPMGGDPVCTEHSGSKGVNLEK